MDNVKRIFIVSSDKSLLEVLNFCFDGWGYEVYLHDGPIHDIALIKKISPDVIVVDIHSATKSHLEICRLIKEDFFTAFIPLITLINKRQLRSHLLTLKQGVEDYLIKPPDPLDLRIRVEMAIRRSQYSFHATPLTGLPGGRIIEDTLNERLKKDAPFSFGYIDIDNFKYFNDVYGYVKGDNAIMHTAYMLYTAIRKFGNCDDFIGHIGGDDFVFITTPDKYQNICQNFILAFDRTIPFHYSSDDRQNGFIIARDRTYKIKKIPLMSVTLAMLNRNKPGEFKNTVEINERITEIKHYLKLIPGSKFMTDRRSFDKSKGGSSLPAVYKREDGLFAYKPLGQIFLERNIISGEQLDEALKIHWRRGVILGEVLKELGLVSEKVLTDALKLQESVEPANRLYK